MTVRLTRWGHSCVTLDDEQGRLVIDPGTLSQVADALAGADAILVTHEHADHVAVEPVVAAAQAGIPVWGPRSVVDLLLAAGAPEGQLHEVQPGDRLHVHGFDVQVLGEWHAVIHPDVPRVTNVGYLVAGILHPGDSHVQSPDSPDVQLLPIGGPWLVLAEAIDTARDAAARRVVPIHDGHLSTPGRALAHTLVDRLVRGSELVPLGPGESIDVG